jgi:hypothetical protein
MALSCAFDLGPDPGNQGQALAIRQPAVGVYTSADGGRALCFAAIRCDQVQLRFVVLETLLLALGDKGDLVTPGAPAWLCVFVTAGGQQAGPTAQGGHQPKAAGGLVVFHRTACHRSHCLRPIG